MRGEVEFQVINNLLCLFWQSVFVHQRQHGTFDRCQRFGQMQHYARRTVLQLLLIIAVAHHRKEHAVNANRRFNIVRNVGLVGVGVEVSHLCAREFFVLRQVVIGATMNAFHLLEAERHAEFDVGSSVGVER